MQETMRLLIELQELDGEVSRINENRGRYESELAEQRSELDRVQEMVDSLSSQMDQLEAESRELQRSLEQEQENVVKSEGRLPSIKTQKEYVAVLKEIDTAKKMSRDLEEGIAAKKEAIASLEQELQEKQQELGGLQEQVQERQQAIEAELAGTEEALQSKTEARSALLEKLPKPLRKRYQMLLTRRAGLAVVEARGGACLGCNMHLPPQLFNSLFKVEEIQSCPHCNRLLYVANEG